MEEFDEEQSEAEQKEETAKKQTRRTALIFIAVFFALFVIAVVFAGMNISNMRGFEINGERITATVTGIRTDHYIQQGTHRTRNRYYRIFTYEYNGATYQGEDGEGLRAYKENQVINQKQIEIYVDKDNPARAQSVASLDTYSLISVMLFSFSLPCFIAGAALLLHAGGNNSLRNRLLFIWLPMLLVCVAVVLLFGLALPQSGFGALFQRMRGAIGYAVIAGMVGVAAGIDALAQCKRKK